MNNYKVCILAAGAGTRMGALSTHVNKAVLPVNFKGTISYIIEKFPTDIEIVIALGHKKETVKNYVKLAHPDHHVTYVDVDHYIGPGTGPGYSLLKCKDALNAPFIFFAADTIVLEDIPEPKENWFGIAPIKDTEKYCTVKMKNNVITQLDDKIKCDNKFAFIGLAGVHDYEEFFDSLERNREQVKGEIQVSNGFKKLIEKKLVPIGFTWFDTGTLKNYKETNKNFSGGSQDFDFSKGNEFLYFVNGKVIKFFGDKEIARRRTVRAQHLEGLVPKLDGSTDHFFSYTKAEGQTLYNVLNNQLVQDFLHWANGQLWKRQQLTPDEQAEFKEACHKFYYEKSMGRIKKFYEKTGIIDGENNINGVTIPPLQDMLAQIDWDYLTTGIPCNYHGDLQFDNILVSRDQMSHLPKFLLIDWRQDFGGLIQHGDLYYDLAKLYGGMTISYQLIKQGKFSFDMSGSSVYYNFTVGHDLIQAKERYEAFLKRNGYDLGKIRLITALIFLNMSPLHHDPFDIMLYHMGKAQLHKALMELKETQQSQKEDTNDYSRLGHRTNEFRDHRSNFSI